MTIVALACAKGSPGVTTLALGLGHAWPGQRQVVVAELDPAGGDVAAWFGLSAEPGVATLAAAARRGVSADTLLDHCQRLPGDLPVLTGPPGAEQARRAAGMVSSALLGAADRLDAVDLLVDCGRLDAQSPALALARRAALLVLVARPDVASLSHAAALAAEFGDSPEHAVGLVLVGTGSYSAAEVADALGLEVVAVLPHDLDGAVCLSGEGVGGRAARRLPLLRATVDFAQALAARLPAPASTPPSVSWPVPPTPEPVGSNGAARKVTR